MKKKVAGYQNIYKDPDSGVIVNRESSDRNRYRIAKQQALQAKESQDEIGALKEELAELSGLREEMDELKSLLKQLLNK